MRAYLEPPSEAYMRAEIMKEFMSQLNVARSASLKEIDDAARRLTRKIISSCDFVQALSGPELRGSFGIRPKEYKSRIREIINILGNNTYIISTPLRLIGSSIRGGWVLAIGRDLSADLKGASSGLTVSEKFVTIPWMKWTLEVGNAIVISDFRVKFQLGKGRSGFAHMIPNAVIGYRVPPQFAGTDYDNWITRAIIPELNEYAKIIQRAMNRHAP